MFASPALDVRCVAELAQKVDERTAVLEVGGDPERGAEHAAFVAPMAEAALDVGLLNRIDAVELSFLSHQGRLSWAAQAD